MLVSKKLTAIIVVPLASGSLGHLWLAKPCPRRPKLLRLQIKYNSVSNDIILCQKIVVPWNFLLPLSFFFFI
uniref:Uncharacterized protein n=1 Tax=Rhizophora mucronata TaxID=61149 RepID=A0A2P2QP08_RHIMU